MAAAVEEGIASIDDARVYSQVKEMRRTLFALIDKMIAADCPMGPGAVDALQRAANELGVFEAERRSAYWGSRARRRPLSATLYR